MKAEAGEEDGALRLLQVQRRGARCVALCSTQRLAAVGGASGEVCCRKAEAKRE